MLHQFRENIINEKNLIGLGIALIISATVLALPIAIFYISVTKLFKNRKAHG